MNIPHFFKQIASFSLAILIASFTIFLASHYFMDEGFNSFFKKHLDTLRSVVTEMHAKRKALLLEQATLFAKTKDLDAAFQAHDRSALTAVAQTIATNCKASFAVIADIQGHVLAQDTDWELTDIHEIPSLRRALAEAKVGMSSIDIMDLPENGLSLVASAPLFHEDTIVGVLLIGEAFHTHRFVDDVKREIDLEMTVFRNDVRISTTIKRNNARAVGTHLENEVVASEVLENGGLFIDDAKIFDQTYKTVYWPLRDKSGTILGMWFIGAKIESFQSAVTAVAISCLVATIVIAMALSCIGILFFQTVVLPLEEKAFRDALTGVSNRAGFEKAFRRELAQKKSAGTLFLIDLDKFKKLNDTLGHPAGDQCLKRTGQGLQRLFRDSDILARLGGDEFIVYAPTLSNPDIALEKARQICEELSSSFPVPNEEPIRVTASIGIALSTNRSQSKDLYHQADLALYETKRTGRNGYTLYKTTKDGSFQTFHCA